MRDARVVADINVTPLVAVASMDAAKGSGADRIGLLNQHKEDE